jgi:hypothetical protein
MRIQKAIQKGHLKFDNKMKLDGHPFPQNMISFSVNMVTAEEKGKIKVLTSDRVRQDGIVIQRDKLHWRRSAKKPLVSLEAISRLGSPPGPNPGSLRASSSTSGSVS